MRSVNFRSLWKGMAKDSLQTFVLVTAGFAVGFIINQLRNKSLPLIYESRELPTEKAMAHSTATKLRPNDVLLPEKVTAEQLQQFIKDNRGFVFDARSETLYRLGHIPGAFCLPREDFENAYKRFQTELERNRSQPLIVYCSNEFCENAMLVQKSLQKLGYSNVAVFAGGWWEWQEKGLPETAQQ